MERPLPNAPQQQREKLHSMPLQALSHAQALGSSLLQANTALHRWSCLDPRQVEGLSGRAAAAAAGARARNARLWAQLLLLLRRLLMLLMHNQLMVVPNQQVVRSSPFCMAPSGISRQVVPAPWLWNRRRVNLSKWQRRMFMTPCGHTNHRTASPDF